MLGYKFQVKTCKNHHEWHGNKLLETKYEKSQLLQAGF